MNDKQPIIPERKHFIEKQHSKVDVTVEGPKEPHFQDKEKQPVHEAHPTEAKHIPQDREIKHIGTIGEGKIKQNTSRTGSSDKNPSSVKKGDSQRKITLKEDRPPLPVADAERRRRSTQLLTITTDILTTDQKNIIKRLKEVGYDKLTIDEKEKVDKIYESKKGLIVETTPADEERRPRLTRLLTIH